MKYNPTPNFLITLGLVLMVFLGLFSCVASADDNLTWKHPTQYKDGSALNVADIDGTVIRWKKEGDSTLEGSTKILAPDTFATIPRDPAAEGTRCYQAATLMKSGAQSAFAPGVWVCKTIAPPVVKIPKVPFGLKVE